LPGKLQVLNIVVIALQYSLVVLLYYFLYRVVKLAARDLNRLAFDDLDDSIVNNTGVSDADFSSQPRLVVVDDHQELLSQTFFTIVDSLTIGRSQHNNVVIDSSFVSHEHACISKVKHNYLLADLNSTNGTLVNGQQVEEEIALVDGDIIQIGAVTLKFER
jgi:hypothetical protein